MSGPAPQERIGRIASFSRRRIPAVAVAGFQLSEPALGHAPDELLALVHGVVAAAAVVGRAQPNDLANVGRQIIG
jgi:hypothetical protein